jgi:hypothetical protein
MKMGRMMGVGRRACRQAVIQRAGMASCASGGPTWFGGLSAAKRVRHPAGSNQIQSCGDVLAGIEGKQRRVGRARGQAMGRRWFVHMASWLQLPAPLPDGMMRSPKYESSSRTYGRERLLARGGEGGHSAVASLECVLSAGARPGQRTRTSATFIC